jgi:hypothetical protein
MARKILGVDSVSELDPAPVREYQARPATPAQSNVDSSATVVPLFTVDEATKKLLIYNDSTAVLMVGFWADTSATKFSFAIQPNTGELLETNELPLGVIYGIWASVNGSARITEFG